MSSRGPPPALTWLSAMGLVAALAIIVALLWPKSVRDADGSAGFDVSSMGLGWPSIRQAIEARKATGRPQSTVITYSFVRPGTRIEYPNRGPRAVALEDYQDDSMSFADFRREIAGAFTEWSAAFARLWPGLVVVFKDIGTEPLEAQSIIVFSEYDKSSVPGIGDIRIGMYDHGPDERATHAYTLAPDPSAGTNVASYTGDIMLNSTINWRRDVDVSREPHAYSVKNVMAHEVGHALGMLHTKNREDIMYPTRSRGVVYARAFPEGIPEGDRSRLREIYEGGAS